MKAWNWRALFLIGLTSLMGKDLLARPVDLSAPSGELGAANSRGYLEIWREVDDAGLQLGKNSFLPLRYKFSSESNTGGILGTGFYCPMFEAKNVLIREQMMRAYLPCGKGLYLRRDNVDPNKFQTVDQEWTGYLGPDGNFVVWRDDGWKLIYHNSLLTSLTTDTNHVFTWSYNNNLPESISEDGQSVATVETNVAGQVAAFIFGGKRYEVAYAERPVTQMLLGQVTIKELDQVMSAFKYPDGKVDAFKFVLTPDRIPTLTFADRDDEQALYTWDPATNYVATEKGSQGDWTYKIGEITQNFGLPPISRTSKDGKTESMTVDNQTGTYTSRQADGVTTVTHVFKTAGPLYDKVQKIEKISGKTTTVVYRASYDELGHLLRKIDDRGFMTTFQYDADGHKVSEHTDLIPDPAFRASLAAQEKMLLKVLAAVKNPAERTSPLQELLIFYTSKALDFDKTAALLKLMTDREQIYNTKLLLAISNPNISIDQRNAMLTQLAQEYPDKKAYTQNLIVSKETE